MQCRINFAINGKYIDKVQCEVVLLNVGNVKMGILYLWD